MLLIIVHACKGVSGGGVTLGKPQPAPAAPPPFEPTYITYDSSAIPSFCPFVILFLSPSSVPFFLPTTLVASLSHLPLGRRDTGRLCLTLGGYSRVVNNEYTCRAARGYTHGT